MNAWIIFFIILLALGFFKLVEIVVEIIEKIVYTVRFNRAKKEILPLLDKLVEVLENAKGKVEETKPEVKKVSKPAGKKVSKK